MRAPLPTLRSLGSFDTRTGSWAEHSQSKRAATVFIGRNTAEPKALLVEVLRHDLGLTGTKFGCGQGRCGVCTVIVGGQAVRSCQVPVRAVAGQEVTTIEGVGAPEQPHPLQIAVGEAQAMQCGDCAPGMIMAAKALLDRTPRPTEA